MTELRDKVSAMLGDDLPLTVREGGMIRPGYDPEVDRLRSLSENAKAAVAGVEAAERERTGIRKLKIGRNMSGSAPGSGFPYVC